ncbi:MAG: hypothetical protein IJH34_14945 [Romboutsia sp.]|nr:hypothetical protein [Romboutsia sp.]
MNKYEIQVDGTTYIVDDISYEYSQQDGDSAGRSDDGTMYRDVVGLINKVSCDFNDSDKWSGATLSSLLQLIKKTSCSFNYFDVAANQRLTKNMYIVSDPIKIHLINGSFYAQPFQIRFIQMDVDTI